VVTGGQIELLNPETILRVGTGTPANAGMSATLTSTLTGSAELVKTDYAILVLNGDNTYTGGTSVRGGVLQISSDRNLGATTAGLILKEGTLRTNADITMARTIELSGTHGTFDTSKTTITRLTGVLTGSGALVKQGMGSLILETSSTYTGDTLVRAGTLVGNATSLHGDIISDGTTIFDQAEQGTYVGDISGKGGMRKRGHGVLTLLGHSVTPWHVENGTLTSGAERFSGNIDVSAGATMNFHQSMDAEYASKLAGFGNVLKSGTAGLTLMADSPNFSGATDVAAGTLRVLGALGGRLNVLAGGRLEGTGQVGETFNAGVIAPGGSIGALTVAGDYVGQSGTLEMQVVLDGDNSPADRLVERVTLLG
jgi:fibronectin-binding autotransporter adhesin